MRNEGRFATQRIDEGVQNKAIEIIEKLREQGVDARELCADSRSLRPGDVFVAYPGASHDGRDYVAPAVAEGAAAVLWEREGFRWNAELRVPNIPVDGLRPLAGYLAHEVYGRPSESLWVMGVTGTNGKTSCSQWLAQACGACGARTAVVGTLGTGFPGALHAGINTTPDTILIHRSLRDLLAAGAQGAAIEASSIGLDQGRLNGIRFGVALFTNISRDHLDYHRDMEAYAQSKQLLFRSPFLRHAVVNLDDVQGVHIARMLAGSEVTRTGYSCSEDVGARAGLDHFVEAREVAVSARGIGFSVKSSWGEARVESPLLGRYNVSNMIGVLGTMLISGVPFAQAIAALHDLAPLSGRLERLGGDGRPLIVVDYAHSPDALENALQAMKDVAAAGGGKLTVVFGCGGGRDRGKRSLMGTVASRQADRVIVTSDNPRSEDPLAIIADIAAAVTVSCEVVPDRRAAIEAAIRSARPGDVVLLAGKGHETYQEVDGQRLPFSDAAEARLALSRWTR